MKTASNTLQPKSKSAKQNKSKQKLHPVIRMLRKWRNEKVADPEKELKEWLTFKKGLEENRLSERKRFGD